MFNRPTLFVGILAAAVGVPYVLLDQNLAQTARSQWSRLMGKSEASSEDSLSGLELPWGSGATSGNQSSTAPSVPPLLTASLEEVFRMDLTPQWVTNRWPRVSTVLGEPDQLGMRVALVSGTRPDDVAGSLTYYFDEHHQLQRITFYGLTGDERRLMGTLVGAYRLKSAPTTDVSKWISGDPAKPTSSVIVRHLPVVRNEATYARVEVAVDLRRADAATGSIKYGDPLVPLPQSYRPW